MPTLVKTMSQPSLPGLAEIAIDGQVKLPTGVMSPLAASSDQPARSLSDWVELIKMRWPKDTVEHVISKHGAILLRGLPVESASDFSMLLHAFGASATSYAVSSARPCV